LRNVGEVGSQSNVNTAKNYKRKSAWPQGIWLTSKLPDGQAERENVLENYGS